MSDIRLTLSSRLLGFPLDFFPVLFAVPRVVGWLAHWRQVSLCFESHKYFAYLLRPTIR